MGLEASPAVPAGSVARIDSRLLAICGMSLIAASLGTWWLYGELPGVNWTVCALLYAAGFAYWTHAGGRKLSSEHAGLLSLTCMLSAGAAFTAAPSLHLAIAIGMVILLSLAIFAAQRSLAEQEQNIKLFAPVMAVVEIVEAGKLHCTEVASVLRAQRSFAAVRGCLMAVPVVVGFYLLLSAADPTLAQWRDTAWDAVSSLSFIPKVLFFMGSAGLALGAYRIALRGHAEPADPTNRVIVVERGPLTATERLIVLGAVVVLFALFLVLQLSYLFDNSGARLGSGVTFAGAAHQGFIELTLTALLTAA
jgi:hypothetical protein